jgi:hypothetical protein
VSPPNRVEPGFVHRKLATMALSTLQAKAVDAGAPITVGELPKPVEEGGNGEIDDGREPVELLARVIAHVAHRIPGLKKVEKRLEGNDARSGLASDFLALIAQLVSRNEGIALAFLENAVRGAVKKKPEKDKAQAEPIPGHWPDQPQ